MRKRQFQLNKSVSVELNILRLHRYVLYLQNSDTERWRKLYRRSRRTRAAIGTSWIARYVAGRSVRRRARRRMWGLMG